MAFKVLVLMALVTMVTTQSSIGDNTQENSDSNSGSYEFDWKVKDSSEELDFGHRERKSKNRVEGFYYVLRPDNRMQRVKYYVEGDSGFVADVSYSGSDEDFTDENNSVFDNK